MQVRPLAPRWGFLPALTFVFMCASVVPAGAQPKKKEAPPAAVADKSDNEKAAPKADKADKNKKPKEKNFDFNALDLNGRMRTPQLLYFLERANEELERAMLEKRSFIPHMVRSVEEEQL